MRLPCVFGEFVMSTISGHTWAHPQGGLRCGGGTDSAEGAQGWALISSVGCMKGANCAGQVAFSLRRLAWGQVLNIMVGAVAKYGFLESGPKISSK